MTDTKLKMGMIGGGPKAFIGAVHRIAARIDGMIELVAGCFSSDPEQSKQMGDSLRLSPHRVYSSYQDMIDKEQLIDKKERIDFVSIVTPNHLHFEPAKRAMLAGFDVVLDKPLCLSIDEAKILAHIQQDTQKIFCLTHTYTGYPMVKEARQMIKKGVLGEIKKVYVHYTQSWLSTALEQENHKQASWRTDPSKSGKGGCVGDIGTHAFNLAEYILDAKVISLCAHLETIVPGRSLDDDAMMMLRFENGATGTLVATQIAAGEENNISICIYGTKGGIEWQHEHANTLEVKMLHQPTQLYRTSAPYTDVLSQYNTRLPAGHPEGYLEAFANIYKNFANTVLVLRQGKKPSEEMLDFPTIEDGVRGMAFIENVIHSHHSSQKWTPFHV